MLYLNSKKIRFDTSRESRYPSPSPGEGNNFAEFPTTGPTGQGCPMKRTMEATFWTANQSVLIIDRSEGTREVLQTALNRRGVRTFTAKHASDGVN